MKNLNKILRNLMMLITLTSVSIATTIPAFGFDANSPATYTVQYIIPSDTSFTVSLCGSETQMNFNPATKSSTLVEPDCQQIVSNNPWANMTNGGNINLNFSVNLTTPNPSWVELHIGSSPSMADQVTVGATQLYPTGWLDVSPGSDVQLYARANFTNAGAGTTSNTIKISSN